MSKPAEQRSLLVNGQRLHAGKKYRIHFYSYDEVGERVRRTEKYAIMKFLGADFKGDAQFDLRPEAGTQTLDPREIVSVLFVPDDTPLHSPRSF